MSRAHLDEPNGSVVEPLGGPTGSGMTFRALLVDQTADGVRRDIVELDDEVLPDGEVQVAVEYSSLNYKDGLVLTGAGRLARDHPHVPGIDLAGVVEHSADDRWRPGDRVVSTGWKVGEIWWGGYATKARLRPEWLSPLPPDLTSAQAMAIGTAGFTAMLAIDTLEAGTVQQPPLRPDRGPVAVTGASGGLGGMAVHLLARLGYQVTASSGRIAEHGPDLRALGASRLIDRSELAAESDRPMASEEWAAAVDSVGGTTLASLLGRIRYGGAVAACGLVGGDRVPANVTPFLLRGIALIGIDSVLCPPERRARVWDRLAATVDPATLDTLTTVVTLDQVADMGTEILAGHTRGRTVVAIG